MSETKGRVLVVDDDRAMCDTLEKGLRRIGFDVTSCTSPHDALERIASSDLDVLVTDLQMRGMNGLELCERAHGIDAELPVVVITAFGSLELAVGAIRAGAYDFITKPFEIELAALVLERAARYRSLRNDLVRLRVAAGESESARSLIGASQAMKRVHELLERIRESDVTVLVTGESGTGKELVARTLHELGRRREGPFVAVNCAALPEALLESELFGHERGAFTDARTSRLGLFQKAQGGTLLLDEIGEMPVPMQAKLLRALQDRVVRPVGSDREVAFDARIVAATNRDLSLAVEEGRFREDLYFRLNVLEIDVPPLRMRGNDVLLLAHVFLERASASARKPVVAIAPDAAQKLLAYHWPGNVRELFNCIERAVALARFDKITVDDLPERVSDYRRTQASSPVEDPSDLVPLEEIERRYVLRVLEAVGGQRTSAAKILGLDRKTLYRKLERWIPRSS